MREPPLRTLGLVLQEQIKVVLNRGVMGQLLIMKEMTLRVLTQYIILMAFHVGDVVVVVDSEEVTAIIVEEGLLERGEIGVAEVGLVVLPVAEEEVDLDSNRIIRDMEDLLAGDLVEDHQEVAHEATGVADVGEVPLSNTCLSAVKFATNLQRVRKILMELLA